MPTVHRFDGLRVVIYPNDHRPAHVHVIGAGGEAVFFLNWAGATPADLAQIEISPAGLGLHWPRLDADLYVPALLQGALGSKGWMARQLGAAGGRARSKAKVAASRENGRRGGRPRKTARG